MDCPGRASRSEEAAGDGAAGEASGVGCSSSERAALNCTIPGVRQQLPACLGHDAHGSCTPLSAPEPEMTMLSLLDSPSPAMSGDEPTLSPNPLSPVT